MIRIDQGHTRDEIYAMLVGYYENKPIMPGIPVVVHTSDSTEMNLYHMKNFSRLSKLIHLSLLSGRAKERGWHLILDLAAYGITTLSFTRLDDMAQPIILDLAVEGSC